MADFSFLSDTDDEAVDRILAEATDHVVLEQVAAINLSGVSDSALPSHLETRFRRLKTFPPSSSSSPSSAQTQQPQLTISKTLPTEPESKPKTAFSSTDTVGKLTGSTRHDVGPGQVEDPDASSGSKGRESQSRGRISPSPSPSSPPSSASSNCSSEGKNPSKLKAKEEEESKKRDGERKGFGADPRSGSLSPPRRTSCLLSWCSPKRASRSKSISRRRRRERGVNDDDEFNWKLTDDDDVLRDIGSFSFKEQKRILRRAMKEQQKISREAEKIVKFAKQVSARMDVHSHGIERDISDDDELCD